MDFAPPDFREVPYGSIEASACAPRVDDRRWRGMVIRAPDRILVAHGEKTMLPLCGFYQLPSLPLIQGAVMVVHVRGLTAPIAPESGQVVIDSGENAPDEPAPVKPLDPRAWEHKVSVAYFHLDGQRYLKQTLPPGRYEAYVSYGQAQSNVVRFEVVGG